jgi:hypothetical protein
MSTPRITAHVYNYTDSSGQTHTAFVHEEDTVPMVRILQDDGSTSVAVPASELPGTLVGPVGFQVEGPHDFISPPPAEKRWVLMPPVVYRYMLQRYIDDFFESGRLMLGSFATFKQHADEQRGDTQEGVNVITATGESLTVLMGAQHGMNSLVLSTSVRGDEDLMRQFGCDGYFRIIDTHYFGRAIGECLHGYTDGLEGFCTYRDHHLIRRKIPASFAAGIKAVPENDFELEQALAHAQALGGVEVFFSKRRQYEHQAEYRIIWNLLHQVREPLVVECREAVRYCEKVT